MKVIAVLTTLLLLSGSAKAQSPTSTNSIHLELGGNGVIYSVNYDHLFTPSLGGRAGIGISGPSFAIMGGFPVMAYYLTGSGNGKLELGLGACIIAQPDTQGFSFGNDDNEFEGSGVLGTATVGYRHQPAEGGFVFRVGLTPFFGTFVHHSDFGYVTETKEDVFKFIFHGGISFGYAF